MVVFSQLGNLGRLGNQLFQVAATLAHANRMEVRAQFNKWDYNKYFINPMDDKLSMEFDYLFNDVEHDLFFVPEPSKFTAPPASKNLVFQGFFQSEKYFADAKELIVRHFKPKNEFMQVVREAGKDFLNLKNTVAIHVRRGDYLDTKSGFPVLTAENAIYYDEAVNYIIFELAKKHTFVIFSDDIAWCKSNFPKENCVFAEGNSEMVDLYLMAQCQHHIIANSSFSWWGAWLSENLFSNEGIVVAPKIWDNAIKKIDRQDIYLPKWTIL